MLNNMKKTALAALIIASGINAAAAESVQVKVVGTIIPAACTPTFSDGGVIDYGYIRADSLSADSYTVLPQMTLEFAINCDAPAKVAVRAFNDRLGTLAGVAEAANGNGRPPVSLLDGSVGSVAASGLGLDGESRIGGYSMKIVRSSVTADGNSVDSIFRNSDNGAGTWITPGYGALINTDARISTWAETGTTTPIAFKDLAGQLMVQAYINRASELDLSHAIHLDGQTTLEVVYL